MKSIRQIRTVGAGVALLCLLGCGGDPTEKRFEDYRERLGRALKEDTVAVKQLEPPTRSARRALRVDTSDQRIGLIEFLKLYDCSLWKVVGERNSALGKVAPASQQLFGDLDFLNTAPACAAQLTDRGETALAQKLTEAIDIKRTELPTAIWRATLGGEEFEQYWHIPLKLGDREAASDLHLEDTLTTVATYIEGWLNGDYSYEAQAFELALGEIRHGNAGHWLRAAAIMQAQLSAASQSIRNRLNRRPVCFQGKANQQGQIFRNVVQNVFVGDVQVWAADLNRVVYRLMAPHLRIETALASVQVEVYRDWVKKRDAQLNAINQSARDHVEAIKPVLASCGILPGNGQ